MVVDDQPDARFLVRVVLAECEDLELVAEASGAEDALRLVHEAAPDVALLDARMPRVDGFELAPLLLDAVPGLRIALLTSVVDAVVEQRARRAGVRACASKGDIDGLPDLVRRLAAA
jgi:DNA-binding NarL/FixJ family response regulator